MDFSLTENQTSLRAEALQFFSDAMTPDVVREMRNSDSEFVPSFQRRMGNSGWIGVQWPTEFGGRGFGPIESAIVQEEAAFAGAPMISPNINSIVGSMLIKAGTAEQQAKFIPGISCGETVFCLGYSEPEAGSDLASLKTRAERSGDSWIINGQKVFTTLGHVADFMFCAARTDPAAPKHHGITLFLVPLEDVVVQPVYTLSGFRVNASFLDDVRIDDGMRVGDVNGGWRLLSDALDVERSGTARVGQAKRLLEVLVGVAREAHASDDHVKVRLGQIWARVLGAEALAYEVAWLLSIDRVCSTQASMAKVVGTELVRDMADFGLELLGSRGVLQIGAKGLGIDLGELEFTFRDAVRFTVTAGVNEVQRDLIARRGLNLPKAL